MVIAILLAGSVILAIGLFSTYYQVRDVLTEEVGRNFLGIAKKTADRVDATLKNEITTFQYLATNHAFIKGVRENSGEAIKVYLTYYLSYMEERKGHLDLFVVNEKGKILATGDLKPNYSLDQSDELWWKKTFNNGIGKVYISDVYLDKLSGNRAMDIGIPVSDQSEGRVVGAIKSTINVDIFFSFIREMNFGRTGHGMLVDSAGTPLICPLLPLSKHYINQSLINLIISRGSGWTIAESDAHGGRNSIVGFSPVEYINSLGTENIRSHQWYIFVRQNPGETFAPANKLILKVFIFDSVTVLIISILGFFIVRKFLIQPVTLLHEGCDKIGKGELDYKLDIHTGDELESLAGGYNRMVDALKESYHDLEKKIKERTTELEQTKNYLESILKYSTDMIITTNLEGRIVTFNEGSELMLGYNREEVVGKFMADYYYNKDERGRLIENIIEQGVVIDNYETRLVKKDGRVIDISLSISLLRDENGKVIGTVGISKDITKLKLAQQQLREYSHKLESMVKERTHELEESKSHLEAMLSGIADGVVFADQENRITFINGAAESIFNIKRDELIGRDFRYAHSAEAHKKALQLINEMKKGMLKSYASEIKSGEKTVSIHFSPIMHGEEYLGIIFIARDITEMKRLQAGLIQAEKLAIIGKMSSTIAHELRNPLVPIGGFANLIYKRVEEGSPLKKYADIIVREISRLEGLLQNILYFTKDIKLALEPVNLNEIINDLLFMYNKTFSDKNIELQAHLSPNIPITQLDPSKIKQALINILTNAIHAMPDGGILTVESRTKGKEGKRYALISIGDTGTGISDEVKKTIFDPFFTTKIQGIGLGLTLTKGIIEAHEGNIEVESKEGEGTTFIISLPIRDMQETHNSQGIS